MGSRRCNWGYVMGSRINHINDYDAEEQSDGGYVMGSRINHINDYDAEEQSDGSYIDRDGDVCWYNGVGQLHREDGPGVIYDGSGNVEWCLNNRIYTFDEWIKLTPISDEQKMLLRLRYA